MFGGGVFQCSSKLEYLVVIYYCTGGCGGALDGAGSLPPLSPPPAPVNPGAPGSGADPGAIFPPPLPVGSLGLGAPCAG